jgi:hypothetical protein
MCRGSMRTSRTFVARWSRLCWCGFSFWASLSLRFLLGGRFPPHLPPPVPLPLAMRTCVCKSGAQAAFNACTVDLTLPMEWIAHTDSTTGKLSQKSDGMIADRPLDEVLVLGCVKVPVYSKFLAKARAYAAERGSAFRCFTYDWRREIGEHAAGLEEFLASLEGPSQVIGHSTGGLIMMPVINKRSVFPSV